MESGYLKYVIYLTDQGYKIRDIGIGIRIDSGVCGDGLDRKIWKERMRGYMDIGAPKDAP